MDVLFSPVNDYSSFILGVETWEEQRLVLACSRKDSGLVH
jgi:hypothetical protein